MSTIRQRSAPGIAPRRSAGISPARTTEDLPLPLDELIDQLLASEEVGRVALLERA
jgi:hypothetical protein